MMLGKTILVPMIMAVVCGCGGDHGPPPPRALRVAVVDRDDGTPQIGVKLVIVEATTNRVAAGPALTGAGGRWQTAVAPGARYQVLAYPAGGRGVFALPEAFEPALSREDTVALRIVTYFHAAYADRLPRISGRVVSAATGRPLSGAFIGTPGFPYLDDHAGLYTVREDVTDDEGRFHVADIPFALDPETQRIRQVEPLLVSRSGYLPRSWVHEPATGDDNLDIAGVVIRLVPGDGDLEISGRVRFREAAVKDLAVGLAFYADVAPAASRPGDGGGVSSAVRDGGQGVPAVPAQGAMMPGFVAVTDPTGVFRVSGVPAGFYMVHPGFPRDDGYVFLPVSGSAGLVEVRPGGENDAGDVPVLRAISPRRPLPGEALPDTLPELAWAAVAEADSYVVVIDGHREGTTATATWQVPDDAPLAVGAHFLLVFGITTEGAYVAGMEYGVRFLVSCAPLPRTADCRVRHVDKRNLGQG